jgi:GR25 family glycosyltransferase involved in LPS biosynthesis
MLFAPTTLVISRKTDTARRERFTEQAEAIGLERWSFFDAIDGAEMKLATSTPSRHGRHGRPSPEPLCAGEIGCALSHLAIWRTALAARLAPVCVMEDDIEFVNPETFAEAWDEFLSELPSDCLLVHAGGSDFYAETSPLAISEHVARVRLTYGTRFMLLSRMAMELLSVLAAPMNDPADWLLEPLFATGRVYFPRRAIMRHLDLPGIEQTITKGDAP